MSLPFAVRLRAHAAGLEEVVDRVAAGGRDAADLVALAAGPLPLLAALASSSAAREARVVGLLPVSAGDSIEKVLARRDAAEGEVLVLGAVSAEAGGTAAEVPVLGAGSAGTDGVAAVSGRPVAPKAGGGVRAGAGLDDACALVEQLLKSMRGATARIDSASLAGLAEGAGVPESEVAARLAEAGVSQLEVLPGDAATAPLEPTFALVAPASIDGAFVESLLSRPPSSLSIQLAEDATGVALLRAVALARITGHGPIAVGGSDELKGPDACLAFGADRLEARLDPPGSMGSRTRAYGEAAVRGAQLSLRPPARRAKAGKAIAHILDEHVDPEALPGGDVAAPLPVVVPPRTPEVRS